MATWAQRRRQSSRRRSADAARRPGRAPTRSRRADWRGSVAIASDRPTASAVVDDYLAVGVDGIVYVGSRRRQRSTGDGRRRMSSGTANFAVTLVRGPNWDESVGIREQEAWDAHAAFMDALVDDGFILLGGPVGDHRQTLHAIQAADEEDIRRRLAEDPWAQAELLEIGSIRPWALWLDFRTAGSSS
jgi:uncharacterized protein YciI